MIIIYPNVALHLSSLVHSNGSVQFLGKHRIPLQTAIESENPMSLPEEEDGFVSSSNHIWDEFPLKSPRNTTGRFPLWDALWSCERMRRVDFRLYDSPPAP